MTNYDKIALTTAKKVQRLILRPSKHVYGWASTDCICVLIILQFSVNASRLCQEDGTWENQTNYSECLENILTEEVERQDPSEYYDEVSVIIYYTGKW